MKFAQHKHTLSLGIIVVVTVITIGAYQAFYPIEEPNLALDALRVRYAESGKEVVNHASFPELKGPFNSPQEVTKACISCHTERHDEVMASNHWSWDRVSYVEGKGVKSLGKKNALNNFCIGVNGNEVACASCHVGYGLSDVKDFDFNEPNNVDCLSCHADQKDYAKGKSMSGFPAKEVDLGRAARSVGDPKSEQCGSCHFFGGGGNNVKHGDLEVALLGADRQMDVHMAKDGMNMTCTDCHTAENHQIKGKLYSVSSNNVNRLFCEDCHSSTPHLSEMINTHSAKVSCQTCHIPEYAKGNATKMEWNWSDAGHLKDGKPYSVDDEHGDHTYMSIKGSFKWETNVTPEYVWFNGKADHYFLGDKIDPEAGPVQINSLLGNHDDPESKIIPVKVHRGDQIYDTKYKTLIQPKLYSDTKGDSAFWKDFDWKAASEAGMKNIGLPYSGSHDFIRTEMYWPVNHMVSPAEDALQCADCHTPNNGRLENLAGFYLPGRDRNSFLDTLGMWMLILSVMGIMFHASSRIVTHIKQEKNLEMEDFEEFKDEKN